jgi:hypothetical protein
MSETRLQEAFQFVRRHFFPEWDKTGEWKTQNRGIEDCDTYELIGGLCLKDRKTILVFRIPDDEDDLKMLLIHEICHVFAEWHGKKWLDKMLRAAKKASDLGMDSLSKNLILNVFAHHRLRMKRGK